MLHVGPGRVLRHSGNCHLSLLDDYPLKKSVWPANERLWRAEFIHLSLTNSSNNWIPVDLGSDPQTWEGAQLRQAQKETTNLCPICQPTGL